MVAAAAPGAWHRAVRQFRQINPGNTRAIAIERVAELSLGRLRPGGLLYNRLDAEWEWRRSVGRSYRGQVVAELRIGPDGMCGCLDAPAGLCI
jgi:hypothetical protein